MRVEDALRKIRLLRRFIPENGATEPEAETAAHLAQALMERYCVGKEDVQPVASPRNRMSWVYWEQLLEDFGIALNRFGGRASAPLGNGALIVIRLATGGWHLQQRSPEGWKVSVRDCGLESLREYLAKHGPRSYSLAG